jgi:hypothetical protein
MHIKMEKAVTPRRVQTSAAHFHPHASPLLQKPCTSAARWHFHPRPVRFSLLFLQRNSPNRNREGVCGSARVASSFPRSSLPFPFDPDDFVVFGPRGGATRSTSRPQCPLPARVDGAVVALDVGVHIGGRLRAWSAASAGVRCPCPPAASAALAVS